MGVPPHRARRDIRRARQAEDRRGHRSGNRRCPRRPARHSPRPDHAGPCNAACPRRARLVAHSAGRSPTRVGRWVVKRRQRRRGDSLTVPRCWPETSGERAMPTAHLGDCRQRTSRSFRIGAILVVVSLVLVGCTAGPSKTAGRQTSAPESGESPASTTVTPVPAAKRIEPPGPVSAHPALLDEAALHAGEQARPTSRCARAPSTPWSGACLS